jgi:hypothetical protein
MIYFPESKNQIDYVGFNNACRILRKALYGYIVDDPKKAVIRAYCNLPWHHNAKELKEDKLPLVVFTMYETTEVPRAWISWVNKNADIVCVPTEWCKEIFISSGVKKPIVVVSLSIDPNEFPDCSKKSHDSDPFIYMWQGVAFDKGGRKGIDKVIDAFRLLKSEKRIGQDSRLLLKYRPVESEQGEIGGDTFTIGKSIEWPSGITIFPETMDRNNLIELYKTVDFCINPTRGEGFGFIPLEQMAMGKPVAVTGWSVPYINSCNISLKYTLERSPLYWPHRFFVVNQNGFAWNTGGLPHCKQVMPGLIPIHPNGKNIQYFPARPVYFKERMKANFWNTLRTIQLKIHLHSVARPKTLFMLSERTGLDATVDSKHIADIMQWAYNNRNQCFHIGKAARQYVNTTWNLTRTLNDFQKNLLPLIKELL